MINKTDWMGSFCSILIIATLFHTAQGQDIPASYHDLIRKVKEINVDTTLKKLILHNEDFISPSPDGGGELTGFFKQDQIQKVTRQIWLSNGIEVYDYYFTEGKLIFVYETFRSFTYSLELDEFDYSKTELSFIGRYYFNDNKLNDLETTGHNRFEDDTLNIEKVLITESNENVQKLQKSMRTQR
jgi:hypothetical protein